MWAFRQATIRIRNRGVSSAAARICYGKSDTGRCLENFRAELVETNGKPVTGLLSTRLHYSSFCSSRSSGQVCYFSTQVGAKSGEEEDDVLEDGFSELETPLGVAEVAEETTTSEDESDDEVASKSDLSEEDDIAENILNELETFDTGTDVGKKKSSRARATSAITKAILDSPSSSVSTVLDKFVGEGNQVTQAEVSLAMLHLRRRRMFAKALQLSEWLESKKLFEFTDANYSSRVDLIAKVRGIFKAEEYIKHIPESSRSELVYRTLLANCVSSTNVKKSEQVFNKMRDLEFPVTCFSCNQLLLLYKRTDKKKIADVLLLMEKENVEASIFTYQILIDVKGQSKDIAGMDKVVETMKALGLELNTQIRASMARHYAAAGFKDKAEEVLKEIEGGDIKKNRWASRVLLPIYASLGREDEVDRIWKACENPRWEECMAAVEAWGQLKKFENAEAAFEKILLKVNNPSSKHFAVLLKVYANNKMLSKGKDLVKKMADSGCTVGPLIWDSLVKLYAGAGEVEKADSILAKAIKQRTGKPLFSSYLYIMDRYAERGDVHNAEKIFLMTREAGYAPRARQYQSLLQAYINAKAPAYGFSDRMKADGIFPNNALASQLARANAFKKSAVSELLE